MENMRNKIYRQGSQEALYETPLTVSWRLTNMCNYKCSYCYGQESIGSKPFTTFEQLRSIADMIISLERSRYLFAFVGGEPTIHPDLENLIKYLHERLGERAEYSVITNASRSVKYYERLAEACRGAKLGFTCSFHTESAKSEHFSGFIRTLSDKARINIPLMYNPERRDYVREVFSIFYELRREYSFSFNVVLLQNPPDFDIDDVRYVEDDFMWEMLANRKIEQLEALPATPAVQKRHNALFWDMVLDGRRVFEEYVNPNRNTLLQNGLLNFKGMWCCVGANLLSIYEDGTFGGSDCLLGTVQDKTLFDFNPYLDGTLPKPVQCPYENCACPSNYSTPKFMHCGEAEQFLRFKSWII